MSYIGTTYLNVVPKINGLSDAVSKALNNAGGSASKAGSQIGDKTLSGFKSSMTRTGIVAGAFSAVTSTALNAVSQSLGGAISRFDSLNNYPQVMTALGYSSEEASASIQTMSDRLQGLPTALNDMTSTVQGIVAITGDLSEATDVGLALNDMLLAGGASTQLTTSAMEQFRQILAKGKPEMQDWRSLTSAMPGQMKQLAEEMLGAGATADDLYKALGGGGNQATVSIEDLMKAMVRLDKEGSGSITSFSEQAKNATGGIQTSIDNLSNAMNRGLASVFESIGKDTISGALEQVRTGINETFKVVSSVVSSLMPTVKSLGSLFSTHFKEIAVGVASYMAIKQGANVASGAFSSMSGTVGKLTEAFKLAKGGAGTFKESLSAVGLNINPLSVAITGISVVMGVLISQWQKHTETVERVKKATTGLSEACANSGSLQNYSATLDNVGASASGTSKSVEDCMTAMGEYADKINQTNSEAQTQIATLNTAKDIINEYAGKSDLNAQAQGKVKWAISELNEQLGLSISQTDVQNGKYTDQDGKVQDLTKSINELIAKKKEEIRVNALESNLDNAYKAQQSAQEAYVNGMDTYNQKLKERANAEIWANKQKGISITQEEAYAKATEALKGSQWDVKTALDNANNSVKTIEESLGLASKASSDTATDIDKLASSLDSGLGGAWLRKNGHSITEFTEDLNTLGISTEDYGKILEHQDEICKEYDGSMSSITPTLESLGIKFNETAVKGENSASKLKEAFDALGGGLSEAFSAIGINVDDFTQKCADAGVSTETLNSYGSENLKTLANNCQGDVGKMIQCLQLWEQAPFTDKDGKVNVEDYSLVDAQGNLYKWNGTELIDKNTNAKAEYAEVVDGTGKMWIWNGTELKSQDGTATVNGNVIDYSAKNALDNTQGSINNLKGKNEDVNVNGNFWGAGSVIWDIVNGLKSLTGTNTSFNVGVSRNAKGGIRPHADGGIRYHANGAIATRAIPLDIVGEDGAEAIVPLTNKRYSQPFVDLIADGVNDKSRGGDVFNIALNYKAGDDAQIMFKDLVGRLERYSRIRG
jgi:tape measure domain-containing protein